MMLFTATTAATITTKPNAVKILPVDQIMQKWDNPKKTETLKFENKSKRIFDKF
jgi:F0F1-type ATP synthase gamma subunit